MFWASLSYRADWLIFELSSLFTTSVVVLPDQDFWCKFSSIECIWSLPWFANETVTTTVMTNVLTEESYNPSALKTTNTQLKTVRTHANLISPLLFGFWKHFLDFYQKNFGPSIKLSIFTSKQYQFLTKWVHCAIRVQRGKSSGRKQNIPNKLRKLNAELAKKAKLWDECWEQKPREHFTESFCRGRLLGRSFVSSGPEGGSLQHEDHSGSCPHSFRGLCA